MSRCVNINSKKQIICKGDLRHRIQLFARSLGVNDLLDVDTILDLEDRKTVWASIKTITGESVFDEKGLETNVTHHFIIKYITNIDLMKMIVYKGKRFRILNAENINEEDNLLIIRTYMSGTTQTETSKW